MNPKEKYASWIVFFLFFATGSYLLYLYIFNVSNDFSEYYALSNRLKDEPLSYSFERELKEPIYLILFWILSNTFTATASVFIAGFIPFFVKSILIKNFTYYPFLALIFYFLVFLPIHDTNQIRAAAAAMVFLYAILVPKDLSKFKIIFLSFIAILFHYSGIFLLILLFKRRIFLLITAILIASIFFVPIFNYLSSISDLFFLFDRYSSETSSVGLTSPYFLLHLIIVICCCIEWNNFSDIEKRGALFLIIGLACFIFFQNFNVVAVRFRELGFLGILPVLFSHKVKLTIFRLIIILCSLLTALLMTLEVWSELLGKVL